MARQETVTLIDDLDGSKADETVRFTIDNTTYEIDLSADNAANLRKGLADYIEHARKVHGPRRQSRPRTQDAETRANNQAIRDWAIENGFKVADRGRIPGTVLDAYRNR